MFRAISKYFLMILVVIIAGCAETSKKSGDNPSLDVQVLFNNIRIPKITIAADGAVLAFADNCRLYRHSVDGGYTWNETEELPSVLGNVILDENNGNLMILCPENRYLLRSRDNGKSWKKEGMTVKSNVAGHGSPDTVPANVNCSESGITLKFGQHKGRLVMPARVQPPKGTNEQEYWAFNYNTSIFSDDGGNVWQTGGPVWAGTGEGTLAELADGRIYYNSRCHMNVDYHRLTAWSHDGGDRWVDWGTSKDLYEVGEPYYFKYGTKPSYGCNAGLVRVPGDVTDGKDVLLFSTPDNPGGDRFKMTVWASFDQGKTWPIKRLVYEGPSAYSSMAADKDGKIYLLFENGDKHPYERVSLARFDLEWVTGRTDWKKLMKGMDK
jgi:sialidase-1